MSFYEELKRRNVVRVAALYAVASWLLLQVADVLFPNLGAPAWAFGFVLGLLIILFFPIVIFAWVFEMTPEGLKREKHIDRSQSMTSETGRKINLLIVVLLVLAIGVVVVDRLVPESSTVAKPMAAAPPAREETTDEPDAGSPPELSIAVLPFADMSAAGDQEYFTDGISEELLNLLARIPDFRVAGRTSSFAFKGKNEDLRLIGQKLNVNTILEGSVRKDGDQIRVTAQLVKVDDGYHIWSETYDRRLENIFALQDDIAGQVVAALQATLLGPQATPATAANVVRERPTENSDAYASYLRGRHLLNMSTFDGTSRALTEFQQAIDLDPEFALAYAGLAETYLTMVDYGFTSAHEAAPLAVAASEKALALEPDLSEALAMNAIVLRFDDDRDMEEVTSMLERAVESNPNNSRALVVLSRFYANGDRQDDAERARLRAYQVDPLSPIVLGELAVTYKVNGAEAQSARFMEELAAVDPGSAFTYTRRSDIAYFDGDFIETVKWLHRAVAADPRVLLPRLDIARELLSIGALEAARAYAEEAYALNPASPRAVARLVDVMQYQGERQAALDIVDAKLEQFPTDIYLQSYRATILFHMERYDDARAQIEALAPVLLETPPRFAGGASYFYAPRLMWIFRRQGEPGRAEAIYDAFEASLSEMGEGWFIGLGGGRHALLARWAAGIGHRDTMLAELEALAETSDGSYELFRDPTFYQHAKDPDYAEIAGRFEAIRAQHREALAAAGVL